jgi:hypothetical protein
VRLDRTWDRIVWGAIAGLAGVLVGAGIGMFIIFQRPDLPFNRVLVLFSGVYFFIAGFWKGPLAADLFGAAAHGVAGYAQASVDPLSRNAPAETVPSDRSMEVLGMLYFLGALAIGWYFA